jgi:glycosyltransferase involved in cell wall biosynthesis
MRLGVYADLNYHPVEGGVGTDIAFGRYLVALGERLGRITVFGRAAGSGETLVVLPSDVVDFVPLPFYPSLTDVIAVARAFPASLRLFEKKLARLEGVWVFGPHPYSSAFARLARRAGKGVVLGVRQDFPAYMAHRIRGLARRPALLSARLLERDFRRLARTTPTIVVGQDLGDRYSQCADLLVTRISLISERDIVSLPAGRTRACDRTRSIFTVSRLDPEKNPLLLLDVLQELKASDPAWRMQIVGDGPLAGAMAERVRARGLGQDVELLGAMPFGYPLLDRYRHAGVFLHVSLTEGVPQVLLEAMASGLPIVATDVGGVAETVGYGERAVLIPPRDARAAAAAVERVAREGALRARLVESGIAYARSHSMEASVEETHSFLQSVVFR